MAKNEMNNTDTYIVEDAAKPSKLGHGPEGDRDYKLDGTNPDVSDTPSTTTP